LGIIDANRREKEKLKREEASTLALVVRKKEDAIELFKKQKYPKLKPARKSSATYDPHATSLGYAKGKQINLNQVGGGTPAKPLK
jgi:hypothetical protein